MLELPSPEWIRRQQNTLTTKLIIQLHFYYCSLILKAINNETNKIDTADINSKLETKKDAGAGQDKQSARDKTKQLFSNVTAVSKLLPTSGSPTSDASLSTANNMIKAVGSIAKNIVISAVVFKGIELFITALDSLYTSADQAKENLQNSLGDFNETTDNLQEYETHLESCKNKIKELQQLSKNGTVSVVETEELRSLTKLNDELERKISLEKEKQLDEAKKTLEDAKTVANKEVLSAYTYIEGTVDRGAPMFDSVLPEDELKTALEKFYSGDVRSSQIDPKIKIEQMYETISPVIGAYDDLTRAGYKLSEQDLAHYSKLKKLQDEYLLFRYNLNGVKETFQALSEEQKKNILLNRLTEQGLSSDNAKKILKHIPNDELDKLWDKDFSFAPPELSDYATADEYGKAYAEAWLNAVEKTSLRSPLSFQEAWDSIGKTGDEQANQVALEDRDKLLELAEAGRLTEEAFKQSSISSIFKEAGISIEEATKKINNMKASSEQLSSMKTGISSITSILEEKREKRSDEDTKTEGVDPVNLNNMPDDVKAQTKEYKHFVEVLGNGKSSMDACEKAANKLASAYVNSGNFLANLTDENQDYYKSVLEEMGVENAAAIVTDSLNRQKVNAQLANLNLSNTTENEITALGSYISALDDSSNSLAYYALQQQIANNNALDSSDSISNLQSLAEQCGITGEAIKWLGYLQASQAKLEELEAKGGGNGAEWDNTIKDIEYYKKRITKAVDKRVKVNTKGNKNTNETPKNTNGTPSSKTKVKEEINWLERALDVLQKKLDTTSSKLSNLFSVTAKNKNLNKQIKQIDKQISAYRNVINKYNSKMKKADKKLVFSDNKKTNDNIVSKIKNGKIKGSLSSLTSTYGEEPGKKIKQYIGYYDSYLDSKKKLENKKTERREKVQQKYQNRVDYAEAGISLYEQQKENAVTAKKKNDYLNQELKQYKESYRYQLSIAKLNKNATEQARLRAEYESKITTLKKEQLQNTLDENSGKNDLLEARLSNVSKADDKNQILNEQLGIVRADTAAYEKNYNDALSYRSSQGKLASNTLKKDKSKTLKSSQKSKINKLISQNKPIPDNLLNLCSPKTQEQLSKYNASLDWVSDALKNKNLNAEQSATKEREIEIEKHQNLADKHQAVLNRHSAQKNLETTGVGKNAHIQEEIQATNALYNEKIAIAQIEGNIDEMQQLQAEREKAIRDLEAERHLNLATDYQAQLDTLAAQRENLNTANEKNALINTEMYLTKQLYQEKMEAARIEGNINEQEKLQAELTLQLVLLEKQKMDNIVAYYNNLRKINEHQNKNLSNTVDELEARGLTVSSKLYSSQIAINNEMKKKYEEELASLIEQHAKIKENTKEWYASLDSIQACKDGIHDMTKENIQLGQSIRNIEWELVGKVNDRLDLVSSEYDLMRTLMSNQKMTDDTGSFTKEGTATLGTYFAQLKLTEEKTRQTKAALDNMDDSIARSEEGFTDAKAQEERLEKQKQYIDLVKNEYEIRQSIIDQMKQAYQAEMDHLQDLINKRKDLLQTEKDAYNYKQTIEEKTKNISSISKQIASLEGDDSEAAQTKIQQLKVSLDDANKDLQNTEYDKWISDQQSILDDLYNEYKGFIDEKLSDPNILLEEALNYLSNMNVADAMSEALSQYANEYGYDPTDDFSNITDALGNEGSIVNAIDSAVVTIRDFFEEQQSYQDKADDFMADVSTLNSSDINNNYNALLEAKEQYNEQESFEDGVKNKISSSTMSTLKANYETAQKIENDANQTINAIKAIGEVTLDGQKQQAIADANARWNSLTESGKQIVRNKDGEEILRQANERLSHLQAEEQQRAASQAEQARLAQEQANLAARNSLDDLIKQTYWQDAHLHGGKTQWSTSKLSTGDYGEVQKRIHDKGLARDDKPYVNAEWIKEALRRLGYTGPEGQSAGTLLNYMNSIGYSDGGISSVLQRVPTMNGDDGWITVKKGEGILNLEQTKQFQKLVQKLDVLNPAVDILSHLRTLNWNADPGQYAGNTTIGDLRFQIELPNVVDTDSFVKEIQNNPKIEKVIHSMVYEKNSLSKYRW